MKIIKRDGREVPFDYRNEEAKQENANKNPIINSTMRDYMAGEVSRDICRRFLFPADVMKAHDEGIIHVHDMGYVPHRSKGKRIRHRGDEIPER